jgi:hypothetical protein
MNYRTLLSFVLNPIFSFSLLAGEPIVIPKTEREISLDGRIDEDAWKDAIRLNMVMHNPVSGTEPSEASTFLIMYDDRYVYIAGIMTDSEPDKIQSPSKKRDEMGLNNDWFGPIFDTFNDKENALAFFTSPSGLRLDYEIFGDGQGFWPVNQNWNGFWDVAVAKSDAGWTAELRIPISTLRFQEGPDGVKMGMTAVRYIGRKNEWITFPEISNQWGFWSWAKPSNYQEILFADLRSRKPVYIAPYLLGGITQQHEINEEQTAYNRKTVQKLEPGLDMKFGLTSNITADITLNTDFAQVEADDQQVNLTRFSLFFPEKRLFFLERSSTFDFSLGGPDRLFYSRRIGISGGQAQRIYGGARLVGRQGPWDIGFLSMQTAATEDILSQNNSVLRLKRQVINENSYFGGILTSLIDSDGTYNIAYGLDGVFKMPKENYLTLMWSQTFQSGEKNEVFSGDPSRIRLNFEKRAYEGVYYYIDYAYGGEKYNPGIGFQSRTNFSRYGGIAGYGWIPENRSKIGRHRLLMNGYFFTSNQTGQVESAEIGPEYSLETKSSWSFSGDVKYLYENVPASFFLSSVTEVPAGIYQFYSGRLSATTPHTSLYGISVNTIIGSFFDGWRNTLGVSPYWNVSSSLTVNLTWQLNYIDFPERNQELTVHLARMRMLYMLNTKFSVAGFVQYNSLAKNILTNVRLRYNPREGTDLYIVFNDLENTDRFRVEPALPGFCCRTLLIKYTYTFSL